ncbi:MAG: DUF6319 family protein [Gordonia sp. (in: high G+C Gram-positive bacteria)]|uniref:DUF6319 family protein n=1 Tax=Gordonia sp. (in: high G+C Gram-positive bacteria) TaxID=84139 RepID=UPI0039E5057A
MPPRRHSAAAESLTPDDLANLTAALADGRRATVYLREGTPSLGLAAGSSARVISVDGGTVVVRPRGVDDELPYEADELRMTKDAPEPPAPKPSAKKAAPTARATGTPATAPKPAATPKPADATNPAAAKPAVSKPAAAKRTGPKAGALKSVTVTLYGSPENEWSVALTRGARKPQRTRAVSPEAADAAVRELGDQICADAVSGLLNAAREEAARRVEELSRELEAARQALAALDKNPPLDENPR